MADTSLIRINEVETGTYVRLLRLRQAPSELHRVQMGGVAQGLPQGAWRRIQGLSWRSLVGRVLVNDEDNRTLTLGVADSRDPEQNFRVMLTYASLRRAARLVPEGRTFATLDAEDAYRRKHRQSRTNKAYYHPHDRFVAVSVIALIAREVIVHNFTWQVPSDDTSWTVSIPANTLIDDNDYTVQATLNTVSGSAALLYVPEATRTVDDFVLHSVTQLDAGTTIDFHVQAR